MGKVSYLAYPAWTPPLVLVIELAQAHGHLAAARAGAVITTRERVVSTNSFFPYPSSLTMSGMS